MKHTLRLISAVCTAAVLGSPAMADEDKVAMHMTTWDADSDHMITQEEWAETMDHQGLFDRIDKNNNGNFDVEEAVGKVLDYDMKMDLDDGGHIDRHEFTLGMFNQLDANDDDRLDEREFDTFASNSDSPLFKTN